MDKVSDPKWERTKLTLFQRLNETKKKTFFFISLLTAKHCLAGKKYFFPAQNTFFPDKLLFFQANEKKKILK